MDIGPRHEIVFLNELHNRIRENHSHDGASDRFAGFFRIIGRLVDYDVSTQTAKVLSCFHQLYPPDTPLKDVPMEPSPQHQKQLQPAPTADTIDLVSSDSEAEQEYISMLTPPEPVSNDRPVNNKIISFSSTTTRHDNNSASSNSTTTHQEGLIDLTSDVDDAMDEIEYTQPGEVGSWDTPKPTPDHQQSRGKSVRLSLELVEAGKAEHLPRPDLDKGKQRADTSRWVDHDRHPSSSVGKGKQRAEPRNMDQDRQTSHRPSMNLKGKQHKSRVDQGRQTHPDKDQHEKRHEEQKEDEPPKQPQPPPEPQPPPPSPLTAPVVQLWVDTQLLGPWMYEPRALFEFSGQVVFDRTLGDDSDCLSVGSRAKNSSGTRREGPGRWAMLAKSARNMEGLDLHAYRHSVLRIRELMQDGI